MDDINVRPERPGVNTSIDLPTTSPFDSSFTLVTREEWGAEPPTSQSDLSWLPTYIRFIHTEAFDTCQTREACIREVKKLQKRDMEAGKPDINFSFLVGEGGTIYEGRGWKTDHELPKEYKEVQGKAISIAYMGHYLHEAPPWEKMIGAFNLIVHGISQKLLSPFLDFQHLIFDKLN